MFSEMIKDLKNGTLPEITPLQKRLQFAITKKLGVIKQPYLFWPPDPKQNPPATHILWAALILEDNDNVNLAADILMQEHNERMAAKAGGQSKGQSLLKRQAIIQTTLEELKDLLPPDSLQPIIQKKIRKIFSSSSSI